MAGASSLLVKLIEKLTHKNNSGECRSTKKKTCAVLLLALQVVMLVLFGCFFHYDTHADSRFANNPGNVESSNAILFMTEDFVNRYGLFHDVHIMIFIGFGFLMTFTSKYAFGAVGFNMLLGAVALQWSIIVQGLIEMAYESESTIGLGVKNLIKGDFAAAAVLITFGVLLGKVGPMQLTLLTIIEIAFYALNVHICEELLQVADAGGSMLIHTFGAYFGLACSLVLHFKISPKNADKPYVTERQTKIEPQIGTLEKRTMKLRCVAYGEVVSTYDHDMFAMIGTLFLFLCWPSFNGALLDTYDQQARVAVNTTLSLGACVLATFGVCLLLSADSQLQMPMIQNATLAGGVAIGTISNYMIQPWGAVLVGLIAGTVSVWGFHFLSQWMEHRLGIHDTCGVHNLHGMPGLIGGVTGIIGAAYATTEAYDYGIRNVFPARQFIYPNGTKPVNLYDVDHSHLPTLISAEEQAGIQAASLGITLGIALIGGLFTGLLLNLGAFQEVDENEAFIDNHFWHVPNKAVCCRDIVSNSAHEIMERNGGESSNPQTTLTGDNKLIIAVAD